MNSNSIKLTYFKPKSGKYYSIGEFETTFDLLQHHKIIDQVKRMMQARSLPGLISGHSDFDVLVESVDAELVPHLLTMDILQIYPPEI